jgi:hypothetical protein
VRTSLDVLRSVKKYVAEFVLPGFEVRLTSEEGAWERPFCRVGWATPASLVAHGARAVEVRRTMSLVAWPAYSASPDEARVAAEGLVEAMTVGWAPDRGRAHPRRIPIWNYAGVPLTAAVGSGARAATDFASIVEDPSVGDLEDPDTDLSRLVTCDLRLRWMRSVAVPVPGELIDTVVVNPAP